MTEILESRRTLEISSCWHDLAKVVPTVLTEMSFCINNGIAEIHILRCPIWLVFASQSKRRCEHTEFTYFIKGASHLIILCFCFHTISLPSGLRKRKSITNRFHSSANENLTRDSSTQRKFKYGVEDLNQLCNLDNKVTMRDYQ